MGDKMKKIQSKLQKLRQYNNTIKNIKAKSQTKNISTTESKNINLQNNEDTKSQQPSKNQQNKPRTRSKTSRKFKSSSLQKTKHKKDESKIIEKQNKVKAKADQIEEERKQAQKTQIKRKNKLKPNTFEIVTQKQQNNTKYHIRGTFRLFNRSHPAQHLFISQAFHTTTIHTETHHIVLGIQSKTYNETNFDDLQPYHQIVLNTAHIPQCLEGSVRNSEELFDYLYEHRRGVELRGRMGAVTHVVIAEDGQDAVYIPLYYGKDMIVGVQKRIGYARFDSNMPKRLFHDVLRTEERRCSFYAKSLVISQHNKRYLNKIIRYIAIMDVRTLRLAGNVSLAEGYQLVFSGLIILHLDGVESIEVLQNFQFYQLKCIVIGGKNMLNLRSLRKLHINADAEMNLQLRCEEKPYPLRFAIQKGLCNKQQYTFTNLSYLTEVSFGFSCSNDKCLNRLKYLNSNDTMAPMNLLSKLGDSSISNLKYNNYADLNVAYTFAAKYLSIMKRDFAVMLDREVD